MSVPAFSHSQDPYATFAPKDCRLAKGPLNDLSPVANPCCNASIASITKSLGNVSSVNGCGGRSRGAGNQGERCEFCSFGLVEREQPTAVHLWRGRSCKPRSRSIATTSWSRSLGRHKNGHPGRSIQRRKGRKRIDSYIRVLSLGRGTDHYDY